MCFRCKKILPQNEKKVMINLFIVLICIQTILTITISANSIFYFNEANLNWFMPIDMITLISAVCILSLIVLIVGCASATSNTTLAWVFFHLFMFALLFIEMIVSWFSSDVQSIIKIAQRTWDLSYEDEKLELQDDLGCCGFSNVTDNPALPCTHNEIGCLTKLSSLMLQVRAISSIALFVDFMFSMFIDFAGCAICFHPDFFTVEEQIEETEILESLFAAPTYNPLSNEKLYT